MLAAEFWPFCLLIHSHSVQQMPVRQYSGCTQQTAVIEMSAAMSASHWCLASSVSNTAASKRRLYLVWVVRVALEPGPGCRLLAITIVLLATVLQVCIQHLLQADATTSAEWHMCSVAKHLMHAAFVVTTLSSCCVCLNIGVLCWPEDISDKIHDTQV